MSDISALPISDRQYAMLLEMCDYILNREYTFFGKNPSNENAFYVLYRQHNKKDQVISWFELCIMHISVRLSEKTGKSWQTIVELWLYSQEEHLVDYLYEIYKNIKK